MSFSDFEGSELTDLTSSEEDVPIAKTTQKKKVREKVEEYRVRDPLRPPRTVQYTAKSLYDQMIDNTIDLDPEYQRDVVWTEQKQSGIIDSILRNYYIPPVIFAVTRDRDGSEMRTCIDGKQRLTSIQRFIDGRIPHKDAFTAQKLWAKQVNSSRRKILPKSYLSQFHNKQIVCVEYDDLSDDQEREIFQRVQLGVALTPAERIQAISGPWPSLIRNTQHKFLSSTGFGTHLDWDDARGRGYYCVANIGYMMENPTRAFPGASQLEKWFQKTEDPSTLFQSDLQETFCVYVDLVKKFKDIFHKPTKLAPVEFILIGFMVSKFRTRCSFRQLASAVRKMRADVRKKHVDIRMNSTVAKSMTDFVKKVVIEALESDGEGDVAAATVVRAKMKVDGKKRKREMESDDDSEDEKPKKNSAKPKSSVHSGTAPVASSSNIKESSKPRPSSSSQAPKSSTSSSFTDTSKRSPEVEKSKIPSSSQVVSPSRRTSISNSITGQPSVPPSSPPPVKPERLSTPGPIDRLKPIRDFKAAAAAISPTQSPIAPNFTPVFANRTPSSQLVHDPRRPPPLMQPKLESGQIPSHWSAVSSPTNASLLPSGEPMNQAHLQQLYTQSSARPQSRQSSDTQGQRHPSNGFPNHPSGSFNGLPPGRYPSSVHADSQQPAFTQNLDNPLHQSQRLPVASRFGTQQPYESDPVPKPKSNGYSGLLSNPAQTPLPLRVAPQGSAALPPKPAAGPPPNSATSSGSGYVAPTASFMGSGSWSTTNYTASRRDSGVSTYSDRGGDRYEHSYQYDRPRDPGNRSPPRGPAWRGRWGHRGSGGWNGRGRGRPAR